MKNKFIEELFGDIKSDICDLCDKKVVWVYMPKGYRYCDDCVPRGCTCNEIPLDGDDENLDPANWKQERDGKGRLLPCCEYENINNSVIEIDLKSIDK